MTSVQKQVKRRNLIAKDLLTNGLYRCKIEQSKKKFNRKCKHKGEEANV